MGYAGGERAFHKTAWGLQASFGLAVPTTAYLAGDSTGVAELDRSPDALTEDYGRLAQSNPGRGSFGVRMAKLPRKGVVRFEDIMPALGGALAGGVVATGVGTDKTRVYNADMTSNSLDLATLEEGDNVNVYQMPDAVLEELRLGFTNLAAPGNSPWTTQESWVGSDKIKIGGFTAGAAMPASAETALGHLTRAYLGSTATAFASLSEEVGLHALELVIPTGVVPRKYGNVGDTLDGYGRNLRQPTLTGTFYATSGAETDLYEVFNAAGTQMQEKRLRIRVRGSVISGTNDVQTVSITGSPTGGVFTLTYGAQTTGNIAYNAPASDVQTALRTLSTIGQYGCNVTGSAGGPYVVTFTGALGDSASVTAITGSGTGLTPSGGVSVAHTTPGVDGIYKSLIIDQRIRFTAVRVAESNGATIYQVAAKHVYDATLGTDLQATLINTIA